MVVDAHKWDVPSQNTCVYPDDCEPACIAGKPCEKYDNPLSCPYYKQLKRDGRLSLARRDGQAVLE